MSIYSGFLFAMVREHSMSWLGSIRRIRVAERRGLNERRDIDRRGLDQKFEQLYAFTDAVEDPALPAPRGLAGALPTALYRERAQ